MTARSRGPDRPGRAGLRHAAAERDYRDPPAEDAVWGDFGRVTAARDKRAGLCGGDSDAGTSVAAVRA